MLHTEQLQFFLNKISKFKRTNPSRKLVGPTDPHMISRQIEKGKGSQHKLCN